MAKVYYFHETANAYRLAKKISQKIQNCELIEITHKTSYSLASDDVVGIVFPLFYYGFSETVDTFMKNIQVKNRSYLFVLVTRGIFLKRGVKKRLLKDLHPHVSFFQHITMGDSFNIDFWNYSSAHDKKLRDKKLNISASKIANSIINRGIKKPNVFRASFLAIKHYFFKNGLRAYEYNTCNIDACLLLDMESCTKCKKYDKTGFYRHVAIVTHHL